MSAANVAAMGQHYFNRPDHAHAQPGQRSLGIGEKGASWHPSYYGIYAVEMVIGTHHHGVATPRIPTTPTMSQALSQSMEERYQQVEVIRQTQAEEMQRQQQDPAEAYALAA